MGWEGAMAARCTTLLSCHEGLSLTGEDLRLRDGEREKEGGEGRRGGRGEERGRGRGGRARRRKRSTDANARAKCVCVLVWIQRVLSFVSKQRGGGLALFVGVLVLIWKHKEGFKWFDSGRQAKFQGGFQVLCCTS